MTNQLKALRGFAPQASKARPWYRIENAAANEPATVYLYGVVGESWWGDGNPAAEFVKEINALDVDEIQLHINSVGGDVFEGIAILNGLRQHKARVVVTVDGLAASAASFIAMAGDEVVMARNSEMMIHDALGLCVGNAEDMGRMQSDLDRVSDNIASIYAERAGGDADIFRQAMLAETWYSAQEAVDAGLADRVLPKSDDTTDKAAKDRFDLSVFAYAGRAKAPPPPTSSLTTSVARAHPPAAEASGDTTQEGTAVAEITDEQLTTLRQALGVTDDADVDTCLEALNEALEERSDDASAAGNSVPEGMVMMDAAQQAQLVADAAAGREARNQQAAERRAALVNAAVRDGRIPPARREHWTNQLEVDPGAEQVLAGLHPGLVPLDELGHADTTTTPEDDRLYNSMWPSSGPQKES